MADQILQAQLADDILLNKQHSKENNIPSVEPTIMASIEVSEPRRARSRLRLISVLASLFLSLFVAALDTTIVATAIPTISAQLHSASGYAWIGGAYLLANAASSPIWAKLSDIWGRKMTLLAAVGGFFVTSIICALSTNMTMLIAGRALQGTCSGGLLQLVTITISDLFSVRERSFYFGLLGTVWAVSGGVGPVLGGVFTDLVSWRWCFWFNLPLSGLAFILLLLFLDVHNPRTSAIDGLKAIDWFGSLTILGLTLMLLLGLNFGGTTFAWDSPTVICLIIFGALMSVFFVLAERRLAKYPLMPMSLFRERSNVAILFIKFLHSTVYMGAEYYMPLYFQSAKSASPLRSGVLILPIVCAEAFTDILAGMLINRTGRYLEQICIGLTLMTLGMGLFIHLDANSPIVVLVVFEILEGLGSGLLFGSTIVAIQAYASQDDTATATSTLGFVGNLGTSISIVVSGVVFANSMSARVPQLRAAGLPLDVTSAFTGNEAAANALMVREIADPQQRELVKQAFAGSLRNVWILLTAFGGCSLIACFFLKPKALSKEHVETKTGLKKADEEVNVTPA